MAKSLTVRWAKIGLAFFCLAVAACSQDLPGTTSAPMAATDSSAGLQGSIAEPSTEAAAEHQTTGLADASVADQSGASASPAAPVIAASAAEPASAFAVHTVLGLDYPLQPNDYVWDEAGVPAGPTSIVIDLEAQRLYVYRSGVEVGRSVIIYGADDKPTPIGTFSILQKDIDHVSNIYDGAPMPYMLRLTWDGIAIHGSGEIGYEWATHGCIGLPDAFAEILFSEAELGDQVMVTRGWMTQHYGAHSPSPV